MPDHPNKPGTDSPAGKPNDVEDRPAVENQGGTTPEAYPEPASGEDLGGNDPVRK